MRMISKMIRAMQDTGLIDGMSEEDADTLCTAAFEAMREPNMKAEGAADMWMNAPLLCGQGEKMWAYLIDVALNE